jgi:hypothetical protein
MRCTVCSDRRGVHRVRSEKFDCSSEARSAAGVDGCHSFGRHQGTLRSLWIWARTRVCGRTGQQCSGGGQRRRQNSRAHYQWRPGSSRRGVRSRDQQLFVASGSAGKVYVYDGASYSLITTVDFPRGADNLRCDSATKRVYVGCHDEAKSGAIAMIDAATNKRLDEEYKFGGEPESFQHG